ncbi:MAG: serpin family protein, partial [Gemmatimonadaceae bacterium]
ARISALPRPLTGAEQSLVTASGDFSSRLFQAISSSKRDDNVFISPLSASMALGMTLNGAAGSSYDEMRRTLGFGTLTRDEILRSYRDLIALLRGLDTQVDFRIANAIWWRDSFGPSIEPTFITESKDYFGASAQGADFSQPAAIAAINAWVNASTKGKITSIVDALDSDIVLFLANAIYFKGDWRKSFPKGATKTAPFVTSTGSTVQVPTMQRTGITRLGGEGGRVVVELGYGGDAYVMTIMLPAVGEDINALVNALTPNEWRVQIASMHDTELDLSMPKFTMSWERLLNADLSAMGMPTPFIPGQGDFSRMSSTRGHDLFIGFVKQKTFVDVNEVGTEAAAVTGVGIGVTSAPQRVAIHVDRPFVFAIRERLSGAMLFVGKIVNPVAIAP